MTGTIADAVVQLARLAVIAYSIRCGRDVLLEWLQRMPARQTDTQLMDEARLRGLEVSQGNA